MGERKKRMKMAAQELDRRRRRRKEAFTCLPSFNFQLKTNDEGQDG